LVEPIGWLDTGSPNSCSHSRWPMAYSGGAREHGARTAPGTQREHSQRVPAPPRKPPPGGTPPPPPSSPPRLRAARKRGSAHARATRRQRPLAGSVRACAAVRSLRLTPAAGAAHARPRPRRLRTCSVLVPSSELICRAPAPMAARPTVVQARARVRTRRAAAGSILEGRGAKLSVMALFVRSRSHNARELKAGFASQVACAWARSRARRGSATAHAPAGALAAEAGCSPAAPPSFRLEAAPLLTDT